MYAHKESSIINNNNNCFKYFNSHLHVWISIIYNGIKNCFTRLLHKHNKTRIPTKHYLVTKIMKSCFILWTYQKLASGLLENTDPHMCRSRCPDVQWRSHTPPGESMFHRWHNQELDMELNCKIMWTLVHRFRNNYNLRIVWICERKSSKTSLQWGGYEWRRIWWGDCICISLHLISPPNLSSRISTPLQRCHFTSFGNTFNDLLKSNRWRGIFFLQFDETSIAQDIMHI